MIEFGWAVPAQGFRWMKAMIVSDDSGILYRASKAPQPALVCNRSVGADRFELPPQEPALFRVFAEIVPTKVGILEFARRYGDLGVACQLRAADGGPDRALYLGTPLAVWERQIGVVRGLLSVWDLIQAQDATRLRRHIHWRQDGSVLFHSLPAESPRIQSIIASPTFNQNWLGKLKPEDPVLPALRYLANELDESLEKYAATVAPRLFWDSDESWPGMRLVCPTLLSAVWVQFAGAVSDNSSFGKCGTCGKWFQFAPDVARTNRRFCSVACRSKAYRGRQEHARQMFAARKTFAQIAKELDSDVATVRRWVTGMKE